MTTISTFKKTARAAVAALVIGGAAVGAVPAQAAGANSPQIGFSFDAGNGLTFSIGSGDRRMRGDRHRRTACMTDRQIRWGLRNNGFENIRFGRERRGNVRVEATRGRWEYTMLVDRCDGDVSRIERSRRSRDRDWRRGDRGRRDNGFNLEFNFR